MEKGALLRLRAEACEYPAERKNVYLLLEDRGRGLLVADLQAKHFCGYGTYEWPRDCFEETGFTVEQLAVAREQIEKEEEK